MLVLTLLLLHDSSSSVLFSSPLSSTSPFSTKLPFNAEYTGSDTVSWSSTDSSCNQTTVTAKLSTFLCVTVGYHDIKLSTATDGNFDYSIYTEHNSDCYFWKMSNSSESTLFWISKDTSTSHDEFITKQFYFIGENPKITLRCDKTLTHLTSPTFNTTLKRWQFNPEVIEACLGGVLEIKSVPALLFGCSVADTTLPIYQDRYTLAATTAQLNSTTTKLCIDHCRSGTVVLLVDSFVYYTSNLFTSHSSFFVKEGGLGDVKGCGVTYDKIVLVTENNEVLTFSGADYSKTTDKSVDSITVNTQCKAIIEHSYRLSEPILWSSSNAWLGEESIDLPGNWGNILDVQISYIGATFLLSNSSGGINMFYMDLNDLSFSDAGMSLKCTSDCKIFAICPHTLLLSDDNELYMLVYGADSGIRVTDSSSRENLDLDIDMVTTSTSHTFAVLTATKDIYFGYCSLTTLVRLSLELTEAKWILFDSNGVLYYIDSNFDRKPIPLPTLLQSKVTKHYCPVQDFSTDLDSSLKFLDKLEWSEISVKSLSSPFYQTAITYQINSHSLIQVQPFSEESVPFLGVGINEHKQIVHLLEKDRDTGSTGLAAMVIQSTSIEIPCTSEHSDVTYVAVGCPPSRTIRVLDKDESCPYLMYSNETFTIPAEYKYNSNDNDTDVVYNYELLECPIVWPHDTPFIPNVWIYDDDVATRQLTNNYILWEVNNRTDFSYTQSASDVGCNRAPQTWEEMGENWNKSNYLSCFQNNDDDNYTTADSNLKYEILNSTGYSNISFEKHKATYIFKLTVVDSDASFCTLTTYFSVKVDDAPETSNIGVYVLILTCALMVVILAVSYFSYKKKILNKAKAVLESA